MNIKVQGKTAEIFLDWNDINGLKNMNAISGRHNSEQKIHIACSKTCLDIPHEEAPIDRCYVTPFGFPIFHSYEEIHYVKYEPENCDPSIFLSEFDMHISVIRAVTFRNIPNNPFFKTIKVIFPSHVT